MASPVTSSPLTAQPYPKSLTIMNGNTPSPTRAALDTIGGILLSACVLYLMLYGREILSGTHYVDWSLVRTFALLGLLTLGISFFEQRKAQSS